jgi:hypothetical protein
MKNTRSIVLAILILLFIVCGLWGVMEIIKGLFSEALDLIENILY